MTYQDKNEAEVEVCAEILGELQQMGVRSQSLATLEDAFWKILRVPIDGPLEQQKLIVAGTGLVDRSALDAALLSASTPGLRLNEEAETWAEEISKAQWSDGVAAGVRMEEVPSPTIGQVLRAAVFLQLAKNAGADVGRLSDLRQLVWAEVQREPGNTSAALIRKRAGISLSDWRKHSK